MKSSILCALLLTLGILADRSLAREVQVFRNESMPFCGTVDGKDAGMAVDILNELSKYGGPTFKFTTLPWVRAQRYVQKTHNSVIIPLTRTSQREKKYRWIIELFSHQLRLTINKNSNRREPLPSPLTIEDAKDLRVGIIRGSAFLPNLREFGFTEIIQADTAQDNVEKLKAGSIAAMVESQWVDSYNWKHAGMGPGDLLIGPTLSKTQHIYLAGAPNFSPELAIQIQMTMDELRKSGRLDEILDKWR